MLHAVTVSSVRPGCRHGGEGSGQRLGVKPAASATQLVASERMTAWCADHALSTLSRSRSVIRWRSDEDAPSEGAHRVVHPLCIRSLVELSQWSAPPPAESRGNLRGAPGLVKWHGAMLLRVKVRRNVDVDLQRDVFPCASRGGPAYNPDLDTAGCRATSAPHRKRDARALQKAGRRT